MPLPKNQTYTIEDIYSLPEGKRAELVDGQIYDMAPPSRVHQKLIMELSATFRNYIKQNNGSCEVYPAPFAVFLNTDNQTYVEPDISIICNKDKLSDRGCEGAPDFIIEVVSPSSQQMDYFIKLFKYRSAGVREYWIVNPATRTVTVFDFEKEQASGQYSFDQPVISNVFTDFIGNSSILSLLSFIILPLFVRFFKI